MNIFKYFKKNKKFKGGIEIFTPSKISGWVYSKDNYFNKVALICNEIIISEAFIKVERNDVATKLGLNNICIGFELNIPTELLDNFDRIYNISVFAFNKQSNEKKKLEFFSENESIDSKLNYFIKNRNLYGLDGHVDGILEDGNIHGWCYKKKDENSQKIWLRCGQLEKAISITCDYFREDLESFGINGYSGFQVSSIDIPNSFKNKLLIFSFDEEGVFKIPQTEDIIFSEIDNTKIEPIKDSKLVDASNDVDFLDYLKDSNSKYNSDWEKIYRYKLFLDLIEKKLNQEKLSFFAKFKLNLKKN